MPVALQQPGLAAAFLGEARAPGIRDPDLHGTETGGAQVSAMSLHPLADVFGHHGKPIRRYM